MVVGIYLKKKIKKEKCVRHGMTIQKAINLVGRVRQVETIHCLVFCESRRNEGENWEFVKGKLYVYLGFPGGSDGKESACNAGDLAFIPGLGRCPGGRHGNPLQYSCLENPHGQRSLAGYSPWGPKEVDTTELISTA